MTRQCRLVTKSEHLPDKAIKTPSRRGYSERDDILLRLGFRSYRVYLASEIWKTIRAGVFAKSSKCFCCARQATQVHHQYYTLENLSGVNANGLVPICKFCHRGLEFRGDSKQSMTTSNGRMWKLIRKARKAKDKEDLRMANTARSAAAKEKREEIASEILANDPSLTRRNALNLARGVMKKLKHENRFKRT